MREPQKYLVLAALLATAAACAPAADGRDTSAPELQPGYLPARSVPPLAVRSQARTPVPPPAIDPADLRPDQPENVVVETR